MEASTEIKTANSYKPDPAVVYKQALAERPIYNNFPQDEIKSLITTTIDEIGNLEEIGEKDKARFEVPDDILKKIGAIWVFSGPGTYDSPTKDDKYNTFVWARGMDRARLNYGAMLARKVAEVRSGENFNDGGLATLKERKDKIKQLIEKYGPQIVYNGTKLEDDTVASVLSREGTIIPEDKVDIIRGDIVITLDQVKTFKLPSDFIPDQELAIVSHAPHLGRIMHMIDASPPFPRGTKVRLFPIPTPDSGKEQYSRMETLGLLKYAYVDKTAAVSAYPYSVS